MLNRGDGRRGWWGGVHSRGVVRGTPLPAPKGVKGLEWDEQGVPTLEMGQAGEGWVRFCRAPVGHQEGCGFQKSGETMGHWTLEELLP